MKRAASLLATFAVLLSAEHAMARGCHERSESRAVGLATCHRFGDWEEMPGLAASITLGMQYRSMEIPANVGVCESAGKNCSHIGNLASPTTRVEGFGGLFNLSMFSLGPLRFGLESVLGGTTSGVRGTFAGSSGTVVVQNDTFFFGSFAFDTGLSFGFKRLNVRLDGLAGITFFDATIGSSALNGRSPHLTSDTPLLEGRATLAYFLTPWISVGAYGGYGVNNAWETGLVVRFHLNAYDGTR